MKQHTSSGLFDRHLVSRLLCWVCLGLVALCCQGVTAAALAASALPARPLLVTTIRPLTLIARQVAGDMADMEELLAISQDPHHVSLTVSQRRLIEEADLVIWVGAGLEGTLAKPLASKQAQALLTWLPAQSRSQAGIHNHGEGLSDPHPWLDPDAALAFSRQLSARLATLIPAQAAALQQRQLRFEASLAAQVKSLEQRLAALPQRTFIAEHAAYGPFAEHFGIVSAGSLSDASGVAKGARNLWQLKNQGDTGCVVVEYLPGSKMARQLANDLGVPVIAIDPFGFAVDQDGGYPALLESLTQGFERCLAN